MKPMSDQELIDLIQNELPQDLTEQQLDRLRQSMRTSSQLRDALLDELRLETGLATRLAPEGESAEDFLKRLDVQLATRKRSDWIWLSSLLIIVLVVGAGAAGLAYRFLNQPKPNEKIASSDNKDKNAKIVEDKSKTKLDPKKSDGKQDGKATDPAKKNGAAQNDKTGDEKDPRKNDQKGPANDQKQDPPKQVRVELELPVSPAWRLYDDAAARGGVNWMGQIGQVIPKLNNISAWKNDGRSQYYDINGKYDLLPPDANGRVIRLRLSNLQRFILEFNSPTQNARIEWLHNRLNGYATEIIKQKKPKTDPFPMFPANVNPTFKRQHITKRIDPKIDFNWNSKAPGMGVPRENIAVRWSGKLIVPKKGNHKFLVTSDDGARLYIDGKRVLDKWIEQAATRHETGNLNLAAGEHNITLEYYQGGGEASVKLEWDPPSSGRQILGPKNLRTPDGKGKGLLGYYCHGSKVNQPEQQRPSNYHAVASDDSRWYYHRRSTIDIRYQEGQLILAHGNVVLLKVPMDSAPTSAKLDTQSRLRLVEALRLPPLTLPDKRDPGPVETAYKPSELTWKIEPANHDKLAKFEKHNDGSVSLTRIDPKRQEDTRLYTEVPIAQGVEVTLEVTDATPHTGLAFHNKIATQHFLIGPYKGKRVLCQDSFNHGHMDQFYRKGLVFNPKFWWRIRFGFDTVRISASNDNIHWVPLQEYGIDVNRRAEQKVRVGLLCGHRQGPRSIRIGSVRIGRFKALGDLVDTKLVDRVPKPEQKIQDHQWRAYLKSSLEAQPKDVSADAWKMACHAATIRHHAPAKYLQTASFELLQLAIAQAVDEKKLARALLQMPQIITISRESHRDYSWTALKKLYDQLGMRLWSEGKHAEMHQLLQDWYTQDFGRGIHDFEPKEFAPQTLLRLCLFDKYNQQDYEGLRQLAMQYRFVAMNQRGWHQEDEKRDPGLRLAGWFNMLASEQLPDAVRHAQGKKRRLPEHPLVVESDRETLNTVAEFLAAVETQAYDHACRILARESLPDGVAPVDDSNQLFKAMHVMVRHMIDSDEQLRTTLQQKYSGIGRIRLQQALQQGRTDLLESLATQFHGTDASQQALVHLADRDLSMGSFFSAAARYQSLLDRVPEQQRAELQAKYQLALAMTGQENTEPINSDVTLAGTRLSKQEFQSLISTLVEQRRRSGDVFVDSPVNSGMAPGPKGPGKYQIRKVADLHLPRDLRDTYHLQEIAWGASEKYLVAHQAGRLYVFDAHSGNMLWNKEESGHGYPRELSRPARPVIFGNKFVVPFYRNRRFQLTCFDFQKKDVVWSQSFDDGLAGDPIMIGPWLYILSVERQLGDYNDVVLRRIAPNSGESVLAKRLVRMRDNEPLYRVGRPALLGDALVLRTGNTLVCCNLLGETRWIRRLAFVPPQVDHALFDNLQFSDLHTYNDRVIVMTPGSPYVSCIEVDTGAEIWSYLQPQLDHVAGISGGNIILTTDTHIEAVSADKGQLVWRKALQGHRYSVLTATNDSILTVTLDEYDSNKNLNSQRKRHLRWWAGVDGRQIKTIDLPDQSKELYDAELLFTNGRLIMALCKPESSGKPARLALVSPVEPKQAAKPKPTPKKDPPKPPAPKVAKVDPPKAPAPPINPAALKFGDWHTIGPFEAKDISIAHKANYIDVKKVDLKKKYNGNKLKWSTRPQWVDGKPHLMTGVNCANYLYRTIHSERDRPLTLSLSSNDSIVVWLNGKQIFEHDVRRALSPDQETVKITLKKGENRFMMKVCNAGGPTGFYFKPKIEAPVKPKPQPKPAKAPANTFNARGLNLGPWHALGPFKTNSMDKAHKTNFISVKKLDLKKKYQSNKVQWVKHEDWKDDTLIDLQGFNCATYVYRKIHSEKDQAIVLSLGSDDSIRAWVNGKEVLEHLIGRGLAPAQEIVKIDLKKGENHLLMKISNGPEAYGFYFKVK